MRYLAQLFDVHRAAFARERYPSLRLRCDRLARWMRPQRVATPIHLKPARARIERQPVGVVGVISLWNCPVQLALAPVAADHDTEVIPRSSSIFHFREGGSYS